MQTEQWRCGYEMTMNIMDIINNSVASSKMEGLDPTTEDIELIRQFVEHKITKDELIEIILKQDKEESSDEGF